MQFRAVSSVVRALASHARGHWFKSSTAHHRLYLFFCQGRASCAAFQCYLLGSVFLPPVSVGAHIVPIGIISLDRSSLVE